MLKSRIPAIIAELQPKTSFAVRLSVEQIAEDAKQRVEPVSERLAAATHVEHRHDGWAVVAGDSSVFFGHLVEHGTTHTPPRPFLVPAFEAERERTIGRVRLALEYL